ncbi:VOC family protein [Echinicola sp. CAU 1574]|uniref:VOC family protein n=1 Tax=Echinicola arenosa TaxID=2774144 RepID=A0ABR9AQ50_9BACT|nr:VOC family protein [Echinicola arenosa]MBD8490919.1 VOC family protein [Echinicola arenosa]
MSIVQKSQNIIPFLWYDKDAEEAIKLYTNLFPNSEINFIKRWPEGAPFPAGTIQMSSFTIDGLQVYAFDAGPAFKFNESVSLFVKCKDQDEIDHYWDKLAANGGKESQCGWLKDKFGMSWQIIPEALVEMMESQNHRRVQQMMEVMMQMKKLKVAELEAAFNK